MAISRLPRRRPPLAPGTDRVRRPVLPPEVSVPARAPASVRTRYRRAVTKLLGRVRNAEAEFYLIGAELTKLDAPAAFGALGYSSFREFVEAEVISYDRAYRYMTVAAAYPKAVAVSLGVEKGFHLVQYTRVAKTRQSAKALVARDARLGADGERVSELSGVEMAELVKGARLGEAKAAAPKASSREKKAAQQLGFQFEERFGVDARVRVDKKRDLVRIEISLSEFMEL